MANERNKQQLIDLISDRLRKEGHIVRNADNDADYLIAKTALNYARESNDVLLFAEDCDILVMLVHHYDPEMADIGICKLPTGKDRQGKRGTIFSVRNIVLTLDATLKKNILFVHAWSGCDSTSATFNKGKLSIMKLFKINAIVKLSSDFLARNQSKDKVEAAGEHVFSYVYGNGDVPLLQLRCESYAEKKDDITQLDPRKLPPSPSAAHCH